MLSEEYLSRLREHGTRPALVDGSVTLTYAQLGAAIEEAVARIDAQGVPRGSTVALDGPVAPDLLVDLLALIGRGDVVVPLGDVDVPARTRRMTITGADALLSAGGAAVHQPKSAPPELISQLRAAGEGGLILFTSGSTGEVKASCHALPRLLERFRRPRAPLRTLLFLLVDHIGGLNTLLSVLASGGCAVLLGARNAEGVAAAIERHAVECLPTTPTFLRMLLISGEHRRHDLSALKLITYGTEPMPALLLDELRRTFPGVRLKQTYGLTETGILGTRSEAADGTWLEVGGDGWETRIVDGELWLRGPTTMLGYLNAQSPIDAEGWLNTHDLVELRGDQIRILGRKADLINVGGRKVHPGEVERVIAELANVLDVTVSSRRNAILGQVVAATVVLADPEDPDEFEERLRHHCREQGLEPHKIPAVVSYAAAPAATPRMKKMRERS